MSGEYQEVVERLIGLKTPIEVRCLNKGAGPPHPYSPWVWLPPKLSIQSTEPRGFDDRLLGPHIQWYSGHKVNTSYLKRICPIYEVKPYRKRPDGSITVLSPILWDLDLAGINFFVSFADLPTLVFLSENDAIVGDGIVLGCT